MDTEREVDPATRRALFEQVRRHTGIVMGERKWTLLEGRLRRRLRELALPGYRDYLQMLEAKPEEVRDFIDLVTTNETSFFRTPRIWEYFAQQLLPRWFDTHPDMPLRVWSAAASSGEEAYTVAMVCEEFRARHPAFRYRIVGTDIADGILRKASAAHYQGRSIDALRQSRPDLVEKYFRADGDGFSAGPALRANVTFRKHNLHELPREIGAIDVTLLRNVLIYFDAEGQQAVLSNARRAMAPDGLLIVGESESLTRFDMGFEFEQPLIYRNPAGRTRD
ncbi:protein-glutamate O-methyltransferase CheR [Paraburkholderia sp. DHOC27]|uniref:CheR family methyltransferase n=1 Tax=Paraburkholderia sp. DHOC27 TaxID=2303330 RepID=UPI000E3C8B60|nr:protein-glutamate O-methyltransferase CheR [Paraburkholderia sp. DHOC27]RFU46451.1 protein-glutamate O-methyltransferase CheR [Paraburkholderia sp. DHOC27]